MRHLAIIFCFSCLLAMVIVPLLARVCRRIGLVDHPDGRRKLHENKVALCGGIAGYLATAVTVAVAIPLLRTEWNALDRTATELLPIFFAGSVLLAVGIIDDKIGLRGRQKLAGQLIAAMILVLGGLVVERVELFGYTIDLGVLAVPATVLWLLAAVNAINLLDGINGFAGSIGLITSAALAFLAFRGGHAPQAILAAAMAGSLLGFLRFNFPKATVFLGDAGSMSIGLVLGALSIQSSLKGPGTLLLATPLCMLAIPFFDSAAAITRRHLTGRSIYSTDRCHIHHRLTERFGSVAAVLVVMLFCSLLVAAAMAGAIMRSETVTVVTVVGVVLIFVVTRVFGHSELGLIRARVGSFSRSLFALSRHEQASGVHSITRLQGNREWEKLWTGLTEAVQDMPVTRVELDVNCPALHEGYHGAWKRRSSAADERIWRFDLPLVAAEHQIGHVRVTGVRTESSAAAEMEKLLELLDSFEEGLEGILQEGDGTPEVPALPRLLTQEEPVAATQGVR